MPRVCDLVDAMRYLWKDLISYTSTGCGRAQILFNCIHALLSRQLQGLVQKSLEHLFQMLDVYKGGNFLREYNPASLKLRRRPFMTLTVSVVGKYADDVEDHADKMDSELYQIDPDDPNILAMELDAEVFDSQNNQENEFMMFYFFPFVCYNRLIPIHCKNPTQVYLN